MESGDQRILIVDDDEGITLHLQFLLKRLGYLIVGIAATGERAVELAGEKQPDLVLMDIVLADHMTGIEAATEIHSRYGIPVIFLSATATDEFLQEASLSEPFAYLVKPIDEKELKAALHIAFYKSRLDQRLHASEERYRILFERMTSGFALHEILFDQNNQPEDYRLVAVNPAFQKVTGLNREDIIGKPLGKILPHLKAFFGSTYHHVALTGEHVEFEQYIPELGRYLEFKIYLSQPGQLATLISDITERIQTEEVLKESELRFRQLAEGVSEVFWLRDKADQKILYISPAFERVWGKPRQEMYEDSKAFLNSIHPDDLARVMRSQNDLFEQNIPFIEEYRIIRPDGSIRWIWGRTFPVYNENGEIIRFSAVAEDITERKQSEEQLLNSYHLAEQRFLRMMVLRNIDQAISTHTDIASMTQSVLSHIIRLEEVRAALLFSLTSPESEAPINFDEIDKIGIGAITLAGAQGLDEKKIRPPAMAWLEEQVRASLDQKNAIMINRLDSQSHLGAVQMILDFASGGCSVLPLVAKGQLKGVLVLMLRFADCLDEDLEQYLLSVSLQTAIAIDSAEMFLSLKKSNEELSSAYEATIRGWAQALELRDKETRGHSERVVELSARLGRRMGIGEEEMVDFLRGVLLHDIGKMAIPDSILLKPGRLTEDEWIIMREHPIRAYEMLVQIEYLKPALDIPHYHHEWWDGTGYPDKLKGEDIPRTARIFAVIDTWDAMTSERVYHPAWSREETLDYITKQSGKHFDPQVVDEFVKMITA